MVLSYYKDFPFASEPLPLCRLGVGLEGGATICQEGLSTKLLLAPMNPKIPELGKALRFPQTESGAELRLLLPSPQKTLNHFPFIFFSPYPEVALETRQECK